MPLFGKAKGPTPGAPPPSEVRAPLLSRPAWPAAAEAVMGRVICVVSSDAVTLYELDEAEAYYLYENKLPRPSEGEERAKLRERVLASIVEKRLQIQQAEREKVTVEDAEMTERMGDIQKRLGANTPAEFEELIKAQGLSVEAVKKRIREQLLVERM